jgi:hypothetical protein
MIAWTGQLRQDDREKKREQDDRDKSACQTTLDRTEGQDVQNMTGTGRATTIAGPSGLDNRDMIVETG